MVERNLERAYGRPLPPDELERGVRATFESYGRYYVDSFRLPRLSDEVIDAGFSTDGFHNIDDALDRGVGPILAMPHLGGWEWAAAWMARVAGYGVTAVVEPLEPPELYEWFLNFRRSLGVEIVPLGAGSAGRLMGAIKRNDVVCLLSDRDIGGGGVEVEFFGERTKLPAGPAVLALRTGTVILPTAVYFRSGQCHGTIRPPLDTSRHGTFREDVARVTQEVAHGLEELIRGAPEQWHLMQPNWPSDHVALEALDP